MANSVLFFSFSFSLSFFFLLPLCSPVDFNISRFNPEASNILYQGDAIPSAGAVELINKVNYLCRVGWATYAEKVRLWDSNSGKLADFTTHFTFNINTRGAPKYGHGIAFFLSPVGSQIPPNSAGGFLGLFNTTTTGLSQNQIVMVEFDSFPNPEWDPPYGHVGININSISSVVTTPWNASLHSDDTANAWITYNAATNNLSVSWSYQNSNLPRNSSLSYQINLMKVLPEWVTIGFSAATGMYVEQDTLSSWEFRSSLETKAQSGKNAKEIQLIIGITVPVGVLILGGMITCLILFRRRNFGNETAETVNLTSINDDLERGAGPRRFSYGDLASATNFAAERKLGEGGFGCVYMGCFHDLDMAVAVKKISRGSKEGKKEYITEVKVISRLRHRN